MNQNEQKTNPTSARPKPTVLVIDDEKTIRDVLEYNLRREGYGVFTAVDGDQAIRLAYAERPDLIILDIMLPGVSGLDVCRAIRREMTVPILMLSAREAEIDKVVGLELGADDYMTKPFSLRELLARVRAMLRRTEMLRSQTGAVNSSLAVGAGAITVVAGDLTIDEATRSVSYSRQPVELKPKEFDLLAFLASHPGQVFSREVLLDRVWGYDYVGGTRTVDVHVSWLRSKLDRDPSRPTLIQTVYGVGYRFQPPLTARPSL
jgi:DNA-binding response OmpR family regulator